MTAVRYNTPAIALHWLTALFVIAAFVLAWVAEDADKPLRGQLMMLHKSMGLTVLGLTVLRLLNHLVNGRPAPVVATPAQATAARLTHASMHLLLIGLPLAGWMMSNAKGRVVTWFNVVALPTLLSASESLGEFLEETHELGATVMLGLIGLHASAALWHHHKLGDDTLRRMLPGRR